MEYFNEQIEKIMSGEKALSYSSLKQFLESPKHFKEFIISDKTTEAMEQGKRFHMAVLEPDKFKNKYFTIDDSEKLTEIGGSKPRGTTKYKEWVQEQKEMNPEKELLNIDEYNIYIAMKKAVESNSVTKPIMESLTEREKFHQIEYEGFKINMKIDGIGKCIIDLKKVKDAKYKRIKWDIRDKQYHMQGGLYRYSVGISEYKLIFVDNGCNITLVNLTEATLDDGFNQFELAIDRFIECAEQDLWYSSYEFWNGGFINY